MLQFCHSCGISSTWRLACRVLPSPVSPFLSWPAHDQNQADLKKGSSHVRSCSSSASRRIRSASRACCFCAYLELLASSPLEKLESPRALCFLVLLLLIGLTKSAILSQRRTNYLHACETCKNTRSSRPLFLLAAGLFSPVLQQTVVSDSTADWK